MENLWTKERHQGVRGEKKKTWKKIQEKEDKRGQLHKLAAGQYAHLTKLLA